MAAAFPRPKRCLLYSLSQLKRLVNQLERKPLSPLPQAHPLERLPRAGVPGPLQPIGGRESTRQDPEPTTQAPAGGGSSAPYLML